MGCMNNKEEGFKRQCGILKIPTEEELEALNMLRKIKKEVRWLRDEKEKILRSKDSDNSYIDELEKRLAQLKEFWKIWEKKREEAIKKRMIMLGHIEG